MSAAEVEVHDENSSIHWYYVMLHDPEKQKSLQLIYNKQCTLQVQFRCFPCGLQRFNCHTQANGAREIRRAVPECCSIRHPRTAGSKNQTYR